MGWHDNHNVCVPIFILDASWTCKKFTVVQKLTKQPWMVHIILHGKPKKRRHVQKFPLLGVWMVIWKSWAQDLVFISYKCKVDMSKSWTPFKLEDIYKVGMRACSFIYQSSLMLKLCKGWIDCCDAWGLPGATGRRGGGGENWWGVGGSRREEE